MWGRVLGLIGAIWGGSATINGLITPPPPDATQMYLAGRSFGLIFTILLFIVGLTFFLRSFKKPWPPDV
jgi:hypothetical protein